MKPLRGNPASCSCTGCVYRSRSKEPNVQQIIQGGSEIDKLYYGKFLPLRERKLLEKLIRTRDVYDDVRNQLLASASSACTCDLRTSREHKKKRRNDSITDSSSTVLEMVDMVDRGRKGSGHTSKLSSCCSCCSCETLRKIRKRMEKDQRKHPQVHRHIVTCEDIAKYCAEAEERGKKRRRKLSTQVSAKIRSASLKIKKHLSEPCACTPLSIRSVSTHASKTFKESIRSKNKVKETDLSTQVTIDQKTEISKVSKKSRKKSVNIQSSTMKDSGTEVRSPKTFKIKKDSIILFKEKLLKKRTYDENQDVECKPGTCDVGECMPEECFTNVKAKGGRVKRKSKTHSRHSDTGRDRSYVSQSSRTKKVKVTESKVQHESACPCPHGPCPCESKRKSFYSMGTILKSKLKQSVSKLDTKGNNPKPRQKFEKATKLEKSSNLTKSSASMTSIPKSKTKAQSPVKEDKTASKSKHKAKLQLVAKDKGLEEKEKVLVQVSPKSDLGNKPTIKSTPSASPSPKQKASKYGPTPSAPREISRQKPKSELHQNLDEVDLQEAKEHLKNEKQVIPTHGKIKQHKKHQHSKTQSKTSQESYLRESASQATKFYGGKLLPFPRECEPLMCIPHECDPEKCAEIPKSRGKSAKISIDRLRRKSVGSEAFSQRTSSRSRSKSRSKSKHNESKSADTFEKKTKYLSKEPSPYIVEKNTGAESYHPDRQAVKISSSFSFNIEFYKDTFPDEDCVCVEKVDKKKSPITDHENKIKPKEHRRKYKDHGTAYSSSKDRGTGDSSSRYNISSQSISTQSSKNIQVGHKLKRCYCTLKLLQKNKQKITHAVSKKTMASLQNDEMEMGLRKKRTQTKAGECNPYECAERIKQRNRRAAKHFSKETNTAVTPRVSTFTSQSVSKSSRKIQSAEYRKIKQKERHSQSPNIESKVSSDKSERQAVRIGSNLSINIEFSKSIINDDTTANFISDMPRKTERKHLHQKGIKVRPRVRHETSETTTNDVKTKQTYTEPFLQRCLCTLKLLKKNKKKVEALSPWQNRNEYVMHMKNESVTANRAEISYNHERSKILPDEYGSGLSPYPYNYDKFIKFRQMRLQHKYSNKVDLGFRPTFSKGITSSRSRNSQSLTEQSQKKIQKINQDYYETNMPHASKQRFVRVGSNLSTDLINKRIHNKDKFNSIGSQQYNRPSYHKSIDAEAIGKENNSSVVSTIKRYFSTLKFQNKRNKVGLENKTNEINERIQTSYQLPNSQKCDYQSPRSRLSKYHCGLRSHDCDIPNSCKPVMCDRYECYEENKRRKSNKGLHDHYVSTNKRERISILNITKSDFSGGTNEKSTHSRLLKHKTTKEQNLRDKQKYMNAAVSFSPSRQEVRKESKDSILQANEFRKESKTSNVGFLLKRCFGSIQKKNLPKSQLHWQQPITTQFVQVEHYKNKTKMFNVSNSGPNALDKTLSREKPLKLTLPEDGYVFRENFIRNQNGMKNPHHYGPQNMPNSNSYSRRVHIRSSIDLNFDKMKCLLNPFYKSFYALNVKISKAKNKPNDKYRAINENEREPGDCKPKECDPADCSTRLKRLQRFKLAIKPKVKPIVEPEADCYDRCKEQFTNTKKRDKSEDKPLILGSDMKIRAGVYKDRDPYKNKRHQAVRVGSDVSVNFDFFKEPHTRSMCVTGPLRQKPGRRAARLKRWPEETDSNASAGALPPKPGRRAARLKRWPEETDSNALMDPLPPKPGRKADRLKRWRRETDSNASAGLLPPKPGRRAARLKRWPRETDSNASEGALPPKPGRRAARLKRWSRETDSNASEGALPPKAGRRAARLKRCPRETDSNASAGPLPPKPGRRAARPKPWPEKTDSNASAISHTLQKCFCKARLKKAYGTKSEINQNRDVTKIRKSVCTCQKLKSMTRLLRRKENPLASKSVQYEDYTKNPHKYDRKKDRNNVRFCNDVNCLEYYDGQKQRIGRGDGDAEKPHGSELGIPNMADKYGYALQKGITHKGQEKRKRKRRRIKRKKRKLKIFIDKCYCHIKKGKKLGLKRSMERIGPCKQLELAEREMETIMPYSKKKFKKIDSQPQLSPGKRVCPKCRTDSAAGIIKPSAGTPTDTDDNTCLCPPPPVKHTASFNCLCRKAEKCPVCRAKEAGTFDIKKFMKTPCTCMEEPKKEEPKKDLSKCPMCKQNYKKGVSTCPCCKKPFAAGGGGTSVDAAEKKKQLDMNKPLFQMTVNKTNMRIVNKDEVIKKMGSSAKAMQKAQKAIDSTKYHSSKCKCCICRAKRKGQRQAGPTFSMDARKLKPCICGSVVCKKDWEKLKQEQRSRAAVKIKKCVCGSNICGEESQKMPEMLLEAAKQADHDKEMSRRATLKEQQYQKARKKRVKDRDKSFKQLAKLRKKDDKYEMKNIKKAANASDVALVAESLIDLGTFGSKAFCDIAKYVYKGVLHPRDAISDIKDAVSDPEQAMKTVAKSAEVMGLHATMNRIKARLSRMPVIGAIISGMESHPTTNYLLHMADGDPKKRLKEFKKTRYREPRDFECSLYMASMRKRPCLRVYYMCPWFYPHCMSLIQVWKQFMDVFLFIFAVLVWSPCILCMELCRGCVCCLMCQG